MISVYVCDLSFLNVSHANTWLVAYCRKDNCLLWLGISIYFVNIFWQMRLIWVHKYQRYMYPIKWIVAYNGTLISYWTFYKSYQRLRIGVANCLINVNSDMKYCVLNCSIGWSRAVIHELYIYMLCCPCVNWNCQWLSFHKTINWAKNYASEE